MTDDNDDDDFQLPATLEPTLNAIGKALPKLRHVAETSYDVETLEQVEKLTKIAATAASEFGVLHVEVETSQIFQLVRRKLSQVERPRGTPSHRNHDPLLHNVTMENDLPSVAKRMQRSRDRAVHDPITDAEFEDIQRRSTKEQVKLTPARIKEFAGKGVKRPGNATHNNDDEWYTPPELVDRCRVALGGTIDLDPASNDHAQQWIKAAVYFTADDDGLKCDWSGRVFMNPPYSKGAGKADFVAKLAKHYEAGDIEAACLVTSNDFSAKWGIPIHESATAIAIAYKRTPFLKSDGKRRDAAFGTIISYFGPSPELFEEAFDGWGTVWHKH